MAMSKVIGAINTGIASTIGLASEAITAHKKKSSSRATAAEDGSNAQGVQDITADDEIALAEGEEAEWVLDDMQDDEVVGGPISQQEPDPDITQLTDTFMGSHPTPGASEGTTLGRLPFPVILPQRRPADRSRGFIRAYAPVLAECGIDEVTFLDFLKTFTEATQASPWLSAINLASAATMALPHAFGFAVAMAVQVMVGIAMEIQTRSRTNTFLDRMNDEFFAPRGLYCLIMTYNPESSDTHTSVNLAATISASANPNSPGMKQKLKKNLQVSSGETHGEIEFPEAAPLIFPGLDAMVAQTGQEAVKKQTKLQRRAEFVQDYFDRRAQATYAMKNPYSSLAMQPKTAFTSRYADPTHPASSGSLISLLTGGAVNTKPAGPLRFGKRDTRGDGRLPGPEETKTKGLKRIFKKNVLYLMIVNRPSEEELAAVRVPVE